MEYSYETKILGERIANLTLKEASELIRYLEHYGGEGMAGAGVLVPIKPTPGETHALVHVAIGLRKDGVDIT